MKYYIISGINQRFLMQATTLAEAEQEVERIKNQYAHLWAKYDQLLVNSAEVQILVGDDKAALELLNKCFCGSSLISVWESAAEETQYNYNEEY